MKVYSKTSPGPTEKVVIMGIREGLVQPFDAGAWLDLRIGFLLSICDDTVDDTITGLDPETLGTGTTTPAINKYWIGVRNNGTKFPGESEVVFAGYTNEFDPMSHKGLTTILSSDAAIGTTNSDYWRVKNSEGDAYSFLISDGNQARGGAPSEQQHFVQNFAGGHAAGYATLSMIRMTRPNASSNVITTTISLGTNTSDVLYTSTPTKALLQSNLESFPTTVRTIGPTTLSAVPDSLFLYWPFHNSRLRIHCMGILATT